MSDTDTLPPILRPAAEWWVVRTADGYEVLPYRANARMAPVGPFAMKSTARAKILELDAADDRRRTRNTLIVCAVLMVALTALLKWLPA